MKLPRTEDSAILIMCELALAGRDKPVPLSVIAGRHGLSVLFLKKLARSLRQAGLVTAREGIKGGYTLATDPSFISVDWILNACLGATKNRTEKNAADVFCPFNASCLPQQIRSTVEEKIHTSLSEISLKDLIAQRGNT